MKNAPGRSLETFHRDSLKVKVLRTFYEKCSGMKILKLSGLFLKEVLGGSSQKIHGKSHEGSLRETSM